MVNTTTSTSGITLLLHDDVNVDTEKYLYDSINKTNKIDDIIFITSDDRDDFFKKSSCMKFTITTVVVVLVLVTYYSIYFITDNNNSNSNNNNPSTSAGALLGRGVDGCYIATDTYHDNGTKDDQNRFQSCFQFADTDEFCWSTSRFDRGYWYNSWEECYPCGFGKYFDHNNPSYWHETSGRGDNNCGQPCTEFCVPKGPSDDDRAVKGCNIASGIYDDSRRNVDDGSPFQSCFQYADTDEFCWSKSRWDDGFWYNSWEECFPCGYGKHFNTNDPNYWHDSSLKGDNDCGEPCTEFCVPKCGGINNGRLSFLGMRWCP